MEPFDFDTEAVLFFRQSGKARHYPLSIRRFDRACEAILFAAEQLPPVAVNGCSIEIGHLNISGKEIFDYYHRSDFPLMRQIEGVA